MASCFLRVAQSLSGLICANHDAVSPRFRLLRGCFRALFQKSLFFASKFASEFSDLILFDLDSLCSFPFFLRLLVL